MLVLVLGATGFIGGHVARAALARGWHVRAMRRRPNAVGAIGDVADRIEWIQGELPFVATPGGGSDKAADVRDAMRGCDVVFHAAAAYPRAERDIAGWVRGSVIQMRAVLHAARDANVGRLVYTSTLTTVGPPGQPGRLADERVFCVPGSVRSAYYEAKYAMEMEAFGAAAEGLPIVILNPTTVLGPGDIKPTTSELLWEIPFHTVEALVSLGDWLRLPLPDLARTLRFLQPLNSDKAHRELGLRPRPVVETARDTIAWFRENRYL